MIKKFLVLQYRTGKSLNHEKECIRKAGNFKKDELEFINVLDSRSKLPTIADLANYAGIIQGGSGQVDISSWSKKDENLIMRIKPLILAAIKANVPMLNICFGHQLVAHFLKVKIVADKNKSETGTKKVKLNMTGVKSPIFEGVPKVFWAVLGHKDSLDRLPVGAKLLASSDRCDIQGYKLKDNIYCLQFHPELDKQGMKYRLELFSEYLGDRKLEDILKEYVDTPYTARIIKNFKNICKSTHN